MDIPSSAILAIGLVMLFVPFAMVSRQSLILAIRVVVVGLLAIVVGSVIGSEFGLVFVVVVGLIQQLGLSKPTAMINIARLSSEPVRLRRAAKLLRIGHWPQDTVIERWSCEVFALELEGKFDEATRFTESALAKRTDEADIALYENFLGDQSASGPIAIRLLKSDFTKHFDRLFPIAADFDAPTAIDLLQPNLPWAIKRNLNGLAVLLASAGRVIPARRATILSSGSEADLLVVTARALQNTDQQWTLDTVLFELDKIPSLRHRSLAARLRASPATPKTLTTAHAKVLDRIETAINERANIAASVSRSSIFPVASVALGLICVGGFIFELTNGSTTSTEVLVKSGAFIVENGTTSGGWWRMITASFLHAGPLHIAFNGFAFRALGPAFERRFGSWALVLFWMVGALGGSFAILTFTPKSEGIVAVGASTAIMALVGGLTAWALREWRRNKSTVAKNYFLRLASVIVLQSALDNVIPQVSGSGHLGGAAAGFIVMTFGYSFFVRSVRTKS